MLWKTQTCVRRTASSSNGSSRSIRTKPATAAPEQQLSVVPASAWPSGQFAFPSCAFSAVPPGTGPPAPPPTRRAAEQAAGINPSTLRQLNLAQEHLGWHPKVPEAQSHQPTTPPTSTISINSAKRSEMHQQSKSKLTRDACPRRASRGNANENCKGKRKATSNGFRSPYKKHKATNPQRKTKLLEEPININSAKQSETHQQSNSKLTRDACRRRASRGNSGESCPAAQLPSPAAQPSCPAQLPSPAAQWVGSW